jgi:DNA-binding NtrC family response regulator
MSSTYLTDPRLPKSATPASISPDERDAPFLLGDSAAIRQLRSQIQRVAPHLRTALIRGEAGTRKQFVARAIHTYSSDAEGPFVVCDASALAESIAGISRSTAPHTAAAGPLLESAHGGTLYLGGTGILSPANQSTLFHFIRSCEERRATSAQSSTLRRPGTRILAASDRDLRTLAAAGQFRQDLYARLSVVEIFVPPLRQRTEDIPILAAWLLRSVSERTGQPCKMLAESTLAQLQARAWPNNLRELDHVLAQAASLAEGDIIEPRHLLALVEPACTGSATPFAATVQRLDDVIQQHVVEVLTRCSGNKLRAAELLGISRSTLYRMLEAGSSTSPLAE